MKDPHGQFVPIRRRLDELDLLNECSAPTGSDEFAIAAGVTQAEVIAKALFS